MGASAGLGLTVFSPGGSQPLCHGLGVVLVCSPALPGHRAPGVRIGERCNSRSPAGTGRGGRGASGQLERGHDRRAQLYYSFLPDKLKLYFFQSCSLGQAQVVYLIIYSFLLPFFFWPFSYPPLLLATNQPREYQA